MNIFCPNSLMRVFWTKLRSIKVIGVKWEFSDQIISRCRDLDSKLGRIQLQEIMSVFWVLIITTKTTDVVSVFWY